MKRLSVIIPTYQHATTIGECLKSVLGQTRKVDEIIVVDDGSTDNTQEVLARFKDRIKIISQENQGSNFARNNGFAESTGELIIFCDADVFMYPTMLLELEKAFDDHPEASFSYCQFRFGWKLFPSFAFDEARLKEMNYIHTTSLIRRADFPGFDQAIKRLQDWDLWLAMLKNGKKGVFVDQELFKVLDAHGRQGISQWRPSIMYKIPWPILGFTPASIKRYLEAKEVIKKKHNL